MLLVTFIHVVLSEVLYDFDVAIHNYVNKSSFFIVQVANAVAGDTNNTVSVRILDQFRDAHMTIITTLDKNAFEIMKDLNSVLPKGVTVDVACREPNAQEICTIKKYLKS